MFTTLSFQSRFVFVLKHCIYWFLTEITNFLLEKTICFFNMTVETVMLNINYRQTTSTINMTVPVMLNSTKSCETLTDPFLPHICSFSLLWTLSLHVLVGKQEHAWKRMFYEWEFMKWECSCSWLAFAIHYVSLPLRALCPSPWLTPTLKAVSPGDAPAQAGLTLGAAAERGGAATAPSTLPPTRVQLLLLLLLCQWHSRPCAL